MTTHESRSFRRPRAAVALSLALLAAPAASFAQSSPPKVDAATTSAARRLMEDGLKDFDAGRLAAALDKLSRADQLVGLPSTGYHLARTQIRLGKLVEASEKLLAVVLIELDASATPVQHKAQADAEREIAALTPRIPSLELVVEPAAPDAAVTLDGAPVPTALLGVARPVNPGAHRVVVERRGQTTSKDVALTESESQRVVVAPPVVAAPSTLEAPPPTPVSTPATSSPFGTPSPAAPSTPAPSPAGADGSPGLRVGGGVLLGLGGAGLAAAGILGLVTNSTVNDLTACTDDQTCTRAEQKGFYDKAIGQQTGAFVALGVGAALAATGGVMLYLGRGDAPSSTPSTALVLSPSSSGVRLRW
jgi:hypothetical protein